MASFHRFRANYRGTPVLMAAGGLEGAMTDEESWSRMKVSVIVALK